MPGAMYWEVAILDDDGYIWQYHHIDPKSIPSEFHQNANNPSFRINKGQNIGAVVPWSNTVEGERFHHIHLNIIGAGGVILNPFAFLEKLEDNQAPKVKNIGLLVNGRPSKTISQGAKFSLFAEVSDLIIHPAGKFFVPPYKISYKINNRAEKLVWKFDHLPGKTDDTDKVHKFFCRISYLRWTAFWRLQWEKIYCRSRIPTSGSKHSCR